MPGACVIFQCSFSAAVDIQLFSVRKTCDICVMDYKVRMGQRVSITCLY